MSIKNKIIPGYLRALNSREIIVEVSVHLSLTSPPDLHGQPRLKGTLIIQNFNPEYHDKEYILYFNEKISGKVRITMQPISSGDMDLIGTQYDIWFEDSFWTSSIEWYESL